MNQSVIPTNDDPSADGMTGDASAALDIARPQVAPDAPPDPAQVRTGALTHDDPGRTDSLNISVPGESFVVPADVVSALGQGNSLAGMRVLSKMFPPMKGAPKDGGVPIAAAGGEYVIGPDQVAKMGGGDLQKGHKALTDFVNIMRKKHINTLKKLKPPVQK